MSYCGTRVLYWTIIHQTIHFKRVSFNFRGILCPLKHYMFTACHYLLLQSAFLAPLVSCGYGPPWPPFVLPISVEILRVLTKCLYKGVDIEHNLKPFSSYDVLSCFWIALHKSIEQLGTSATVWYEASVVPSHHRTLESLQDHIGGCLHVDLFTLTKVNEM